jgi:hypothetical protein
MGFASTDSAVTVNVPGTYFFSVINDVGCEITISVDVGIDTMTHPVDILLAGKDCANQTATLYNPDGSGFSVWAWTGPNGFHTNTSRPMITDAGLYELAVTFTNGCIRTASYNFDGDFALPNINSIPDDTINCNEIIPLTLISTTPGVSYGWSGPAGLTSPLASIQVSESGIYFGTVYAPNGCISQEIVDIIKGDDIFDYTVFSDTLDCKTDTVAIGVIAPEADLFYWPDFPGDTVDGSVNVTMTGTYSVMMVDTHSGCSVTTSILIFSDFTYPSSGYSATTITCDNPVSDLAFIPFNEFIYSNVYWEFPDGTIIPGPVASSNLPGEHRMYTFSPNGCVGVWRIHLPFDTIPPTYYLATDTMGCDRNGRIETVTFDPLNSISWTGPDMFSSSDLNPIVSDSGWYMSVGVGANGCSSEVSIFVPADFEPPGINISNDTLDCLGPLELEVISSESVLNYEWHDEAGLSIGSDSILQVITPGTYFVEVEGLNHCIAMDTVLILPPVFPSIVVTADTITCLNATVLAMAETDDPNATIIWMDAAGTQIGDGTSFMLNDTGPFIVSSSGHNGCVSLDTFSIEIDTVSPVAVITLQGEIRCQERNFILNGDLSLPAGVSSFWTSVDGNIESDPALSIINARDTGTYVLEVIDPTNGCRDTASIFMAEHPATIHQVFLDIVPAACSGESNAEIHIVAIQGGVIPIMSQVNGGPFESVGLFQGLEAGDHLLHIVDAEGCEYDTIVTITPTDPFFVDAGPDLEIYLGESPSLFGMTDITIDEISLQGWDSLGTMLCLDCEEVEVRPLETSTYRYTVESVTGCIVSDELVVYVIEEGKIYVPNIFSPNADGINDEMKIYPGPGIEKVDKWIIYDRWGNAVFGMTDFLPGDSSVFWDGNSSTGERQNPAVFAYLIEVQLINGKNEIYHGTITLIR